MCSYGYTMVLLPFDSAGAWLMDVPAYVARIALTKASCASGLGAEEIQK